MRSVHLHVELLRALGLYIWPWGAISVIDQWTMLLPAAQHPPRPSFSTQVLCQPSLFAPCIPPSMHFLPPSLPQLAQVAPISRFCFFPVLSISLLFCLVPAFPRFVFSACALVFHRLAGEATMHRISQAGDSWSLKTLPLSLTSSWFPGTCWLSTFPPAPTSPAPPPDPTTAASWVPLPGFPFIKIYLLESRVKDRDLAFPASAPNAHNSKGYVRLNPGARSSIWVSYMGERGPST